MTLQREVDRIVTAAGVDFHVRERGGRPVTVFVHGFGSDLHTWDLLWRALPPAMATVRYDLRGYGATPEPDATAFSHSEDLLALLDALGVTRCNLVGLSMGGSIALHAALDRPERVERLVLISPSLIGWEWSDAWRRRWRELATCAREGDMEQARRLWWQHPLFDSTRESRAAPLLRAGIERFAGRQWVRDHARPETPDMERLHTLAVPTLLLTGARDLPDFRLTAEVIAAGAPTVERVDLPDVGHLLHMEAPAECAAEIRRFLGNL